MKSCISRFVTTIPRSFALAESVREHGIREPLVITQDNYIVSGHRRYVAAGIACLLEVPCRRVDVSRIGNPNFVRLLREYNRQRVKTRQEQLREEVVSAKPQRSTSSIDALSRAKVENSCPTY